MNIKSFNEASKSTVRTISTSKRHCLKYFKFVASVVSFAALLGGVVFYAVESNNRLMKKEILQMRSSFESRVQRGLREARREVEASDHKRTKRGAGDNDSDLGTLDWTPGSGGVTYERWGRHDCSGPNNQIIYNGQAAASYYSHTGGVSNPLCLDLDVIYRRGRFVDGGNGASYIYGMEYRDSTWVNNLFNLSLTESHNIQYHSVPCAVCLANTRISKVMIPGRDICPDGWTAEYTGYIMAGAHGDKHSSQALCVDDTPQVVPGTQGSQNGAYLHMVETICTSLLCEPFVHTRELSCVVCTK